MSIMETEPSSPTEGLSARTVRSSAWLYGRQFLTSALNIFVMAILARRLAPSDFGLVALAAVILRFLSIIGAAGIASYVIYDRREGREDRAHAAFWLQASLAAATSVVALAAVPFVSRFYAMRGLREILWALIATYALNQLSVVPDALLKKSLNFRTLAIRDTVLEALVGLLSVIMALAGYGVWSLVVPNLLMAPLRFVLVLWTGRWFPKPQFHLQHWNRIARFSANAIFAELANTFIAEGDTLVIGKTLGSAALGVYNLAWTSANLVSRNVTGTIAKVATPALAAVADDIPRLQSAYKRMTGILGLTSFPILIGMFVLAEEFILTLFGPKWSSSVLPLRILLIFALRRAVGSPSTAIYDVVGRPDIGAKLGLVLLPFYLAGILIGSHWGIIGIALAVTIVRTLFGFIGWYLSARCARLEFIDSLRPLVDPLVSSCIMGGLVYGVKLAFGLLFPALSLHPSAGLLLFSAMGAGVYIALLRTLYNQLARELVSTLAPAIGSLRNPLGRALGVRGQVT